MITPRCPRSWKIHRSVSQLLLLAFVLPALTISTHAQSSTSMQNQPYTVEYYYKAKWGYADEFLQLFKRNHYPVLKKEIEMGRLLKVWVDQPRYHTTEPALQKQLYPDQDTFKKEEQRRFEILLSHWDLPIKGVDVEGK